MRFFDLKSLRSEVKLIACWARVTLLFFFLRNTSALPVAVSDYLHVFCAVCVICIERHEHATAKTSDDGAHPTACNGLAPNAPNHQRCVYVPGLFRFWRCDFVCLCEPCHQLWRSDKKKNSTLSVVSDRPLCGARQLMAHSH